MNETISRVIGDGRLLSDTAWFNVLKDIDVLPCSTITALKASKKWYLVTNSKTVVITEGEHWSSQPSWMAEILDFNNEVIEWVF